MNAKTNDDESKLTLWKLQVSQGSLTTESAVDRVYMLGHQAGSDFVLSEIAEVLDVAPELEIVLRALSRRDDADHARKRATKIRESYLASVRANVNLLASMTAEERRALAGGAKNLDAELHARIKARALMVETWGQEAVDAALGGGS